MTAAASASFLRPERLEAKLNRLRAGVLGANDGIVSTAGLVMGVAGANASSQTLLIAGLAGLIAGALSMAGGEYVSVSSQKDTELAAVKQVRQVLRASPAAALSALTAAYREKGLADPLAREVAEQLTRRDAVAAQTEAQFGVNAHEQTSPRQAAFASFLSFTAGAVIPLAAMVLTPPAGRLIAVAIAVGAALGLTGVVSARLGNARAAVAAGRNIAVGLLTMGVAYLVGRLVSL
ncbi:MAG: VIT family protein [Propionibacteriaceae bacterium]|jgi:VIT1/CCC1 family predicted Fe2+/Mn2+ transporter|nr:VIT family protein [Propionibacteriaceae bacterium]